VPPLSLILFEHAAAHLAKTNLTRLACLMATLRDCLINPRPSSFLVQHRWTLVATAGPAPSVMLPGEDVLRPSPLANSPPSVAELTVFQLQRSTGHRYHRHHCHRHVPILRGPMTSSSPMSLFCPRKATSPTMNRLWSSCNPSTTLKLVQAH